MLGTGDNTVLLLHGQPGSAADWRAVATDLADDHNVIVPDRLGYGRTGGRASGFAGNANSLAKLLATLQAGPALVVGHSWAAGVALEMALDYPRLVRGVGLVAPVSPWEPPGRLDRLLAQPLVGTSLTIVTLSAAGRLLSWRPSRAFAGWRLRGHPDEQLAELAGSWRQRSTWASFVVEQRAFVHELPAIGPRLAAVRVPMVVIVGTADHVVPASSGRRLAAGIPGAVLEEVPGGGHLLPQLQPGRVAAAVRHLGARSP